jgi:myxalamid-type polyketide synthase MxaE and MxaD
MPPLRGIIHAAAALSDYSLQEMSLAALVEMFKPKITGTWLLHQLSQDMELDFFGLFSSTTALWGSARLAHYAAANQFLDGFAHYRQTLGLPATSINWGTWDQMRVASAQEQQMVAQFGLNRMPSEQALTYLGSFLGTHIPQVAVAAVDWALLKPAYETKRTRPFFQHLAGRPAEVRRNGAVRQQASVQQSELLRQWSAAGADQRQQILINHLQREVAKVLGIDSRQTIDLQRGLFEMGLDSLMSVELKSRLEMSVEKSLPSTLIFNYPTIADLAEYLGANVLNSVPAELNAKTAPPAAPSLDKVEQPAVSENEASSAEEYDLSEDELAVLLLSKLEKLQ